MERTEEAKENGEEASGDTGDVASGRSRGNQEEEERTRGRVRGDSLLKPLSQWRAA